MTKLITLVRREFWEHRGSFFYLPALIAGLLCFIALCATLASFLGLNIMDISNSIHVDQPQALTPLVFYIIGIPFIVVLWCVMGHYALGAFFDDRKDKSILFWQSMPISQTLLILSKLIAVMLMAPICSFVCIIVTQLIFLVLGTVAFAHLHLEYWPVLWRPMPIFMTWISQGLGLVEQNVWLFPILSWFLVCSALSRKAPLLRAVVPWILIVIIEEFFLPIPYVSKFFLKLFGHILLSWTQAMGFMRDYLSGQPYWDDLFTTLSGDHAVFWIGTISGIAFLIFAGYIRHRCYDQ